MIGSVNYSPASLLQQQAGAADAQIQGAYLSFAMAALKQSASADAQVALLLARSVSPTAPDPSSPLGQNVDIRV